MYYSQALRHVNARWYSLATVIGFCLLPVSTDAANLSIDPASQTVPLGSQVTFDVAVSGLLDGAAPSLGAFDFNVSFDPTVVAFSSISFGDPTLGNQLGPVLGTINGFSVDPVLGLVNQFEVSLELAADLDLLQVDSFVLTRLTFNSLAAGTSALDISDIVLSDSEGNALSVGSVNNGSVLIESTGVPDAGATLVLLASGMLTLGFLGRHAKRVQS